MLKGFKEFIFRGNAVDLAVGVVIGAAFSSVISSLVKDLLTPLIGVIIKSPDFSNLYFVVNGSKFNYGNFLNQLIAFVLVAAAIYFIVIIPINKMVSRINRGKEPVDPTDKQCLECYSTIPIVAIRCAHCTQPVQ